MPSFKIIVGVLFGLLITAIVVLGMVSYRYNKQVANTTFWVNHTHRVIEAANEISTAFKDLQLESNAVYIKRDSSRIEPYYAARDLITLYIREMRDLTKDNPEQQTSIDSLEQLTSRAVMFTDSALSISLSRATPDIQRRIDQGSVFRSKLSAILSGFKKKETELLQYREKENQRSIASFNQAFGELLAGIGLLVIVAFFSIRYNFNKLLRIDEKLRVAQEKTEKALITEIELNKLKSNFVALASHEFRTPLTTVLSSASLIESYSFGENQTKVAKHLSRIKSSVNSLTSILNEFLSLTKIEEGKMTPNIERFDMKQYLQGCVSNLQNFAKPGQVISYSHTGAAEAETDPVFIANIINNLVSNSIKYSPENSSIHVTTHVNEKIRLSVQDNGIGIPEEDQKHLFERFYRASNAGTVHGTGLGLHIMRHYVDMLNGTVNIKSEVGKGTTVEITIPAPSVHAAA